MSEEPQTNGTSTCHTEGCENEGIAVPGYFAEDTVGAFCGAMQPTDYRRNATVHKEGKAPCLVRSHRIRSISPPEPAPPPRKRPGHAKSPTPSTAVTIRARRGHRCHGRDAGHVHAGRRDGASQPGGAHIGRCRRVPDVGVDCRAARHHGRRCARALERHGVGHRRRPGRRPGGEVEVGSIARQREAPRSDPASPNRGASLWTVLRRDVTPSRREAHQPAQLVQLPGHRACPDFIELERRLHGAADVRRDDGRIQDQSHRCLPL